MIALLNTLLPIFSQHENISNPFEIKHSESVKRLKQLTKYTTFYELLNLSNLCTKEQIEIAYRERLMDKTFLSELKLIDKRNLLADAVNALIKNRQAYDKELGQVDLLNFGIPKPLGVVFLILFLIVFVLILDFSIAFKKHMKFLEEAKVLNKKGNKKITPSDLEFNWRKMYFYSLFFGVKKQKIE